MLTASGDESIADVSKMLEDFGDVPVFRMARFARSDQELAEMLRTLAPFSLVSMVRVRFLFPACHRRFSQSGRAIVRRAELPFYPLPIRAEDGTIYFPKSGDGIYVVEEVRAMLRWVREVYAHAEPSERPMIALLGALEFVPINDAKPLKTRVEHDFNERAAIINRTKEAIAKWEAGGKQGAEPYDGLADPEARSQLFVWQDGAIQRRSRDKVRRRHPGRSPPDLFEHVLRRGDDRRNAGDASRRDER